MILLSKHNYTSHHLYIFISNIQKEQFTGTFSGTFEY